MAHVWPVTPAYTPPGGEFGSWVLDNGKRRTASHSGVDWARNAGEKIVAACGGTVVRSVVSSSGWGNHVWIHGDDGYCYGYAHLRDAPLVAYGARVETGQALGYVGATGDVTGEHLHFSISTGTVAQAIALDRSKLIDPVAYLKGKVTPAPNVRTVKANASVFRRVSPDVGAALTGKDNRLAAGSSHRVTKAYLTGKPITQNGTTTDIWFEVDAYGWAWAGGFTSQSLDGIPEVIDARPAPTPIPEPQPEPEPIPAPDPEPETPADPDPEEDPVAETPVIEVPVRVKLDDDKLAELLTTTAEVEPSEPVIPDTVAKPLWVGLSLISVSAGPVVALTLIDWAAWDAATGQQFATTAVAWAGSVAAVLGLSRFAKTK